MNVISVEKVREEREVGQVWPPAAAGAAFRSWHRLRLDRSLEPLPVPTPVPHKRKGGRKGREDGGRRGRSLHVEEGRERPTDQFGKSPAIDRAQQVRRSRAKTKFWSHFYLLHGMPNFTFYL